jgi:hypothetical protein
MSVFSIIRLIAVPRRGSGTRRCFKIVCELADDGNPDVPPLIDAPGTLS